MTQGQAFLLKTLRKVDRYTGIFISLESFSIFVAYFESFKDSRKKIFLPSGYEFVCFAGDDKKELLRENLKEFLSLIPDSSVVRFFNQLGMVTLKRHGLQDFGVAKNKALIFLQAKPVDELLLMERLFGANPRDLFEKRLIHEVNEVPVYYHILRFQ